MGSTHETFAHLGEVHAPVTVAVGATEPGPADFAPRVAEQLPRGRLLRFEDLGHFGPLEDPARIASSILDAFA